MITLPLLMVEDEIHQVERIQILLNEAVDAMDDSIQFRLTAQDDYPKGSASIASTPFPLMIIDLHLPGYSPVKDRGKSPFAGMELVKEARSMNKDVVIAVFSAFSGQNVSELVDLHIDAVLKKAGRDADDWNRNALTRVIELTLQRYNYRMNINITSALELAFSSPSDLTHTNTGGSYEFCFRKLLSGVRDSVHYDYVGRGRSGAGVVAAWPDERLPEIFKCAPYAELKTELAAYENHVKNRIRRCAHTDSERLAQFGSHGVLSYSFEGSLHFPSTLGRVIEQQPIGDTLKAISEHFEVNCQRWYTHSDVKPRGLAEQCKSHFLSDEDLAKFPDMLNDIPAEATAQVTAWLQQNYSPKPSSPSDVRDKILHALKVRRRPLPCKSETTVHGDLNVGNLIWDDSTQLLSMIDFAKTVPNAPRMIDFAKLEASVKFHIPIANRDNLDTSQCIALSLASEARILSGMSFADQDKEGQDECQQTIDLKKDLVIKHIRGCAKEQCGPRPQDEYFLALFFVTAKHIMYSRRDYLSAIQTGRTNDANYSIVTLAHALASTFHLARLTEGTVLA